MKLKMVINIDDRIFVGEISVEESGPDEVVLDGDAKFICKRNEQLDGDRIFEDYAMLGWAE